MVPFFDLIRQNKSIHPEIDRAVGRVIKNGYFTLGPEVGEFESEFCKYIGVKYGVGVASGTDALTLAVKALGLGKGDEVIIPANVYPTVFGVALAGVDIKLCDCNKQGNIDPSDLANKLTKKTRAVVAVHLYGNPADISGVMKVIENYGRKIYLIEDAAQAHGAQIKFKDQGQKMKVGSAGDVGVFSFYPTKNLGAYGDGGMVVTNDESIFKRVQKLRQYGEINRYHSEIISGVSRLDELQAAILRIKLKHLDSWNEKRTKIADKYKRSLNKSSDLKVIINEQGISSHHLFVIRSDKRDELKKYLEENGIATAIHYPVPIHLTVSFKYLGHKQGDFPESEKLSREVLSLPLFPELKSKELDYIIGVIRSFSVD